MKFFSASLLVFAVGFFAWVIEPAESPIASFETAELSAPADDVVLARVDVAFAE